MDHVSKGQMVSGLLDQIWTTDASKGSLKIKTLDGNYCCCQMEDQRGAANITKKPTWTRWSEPSLDMHMCAYIICM